MQKKNSVGPFFFLLRFSEPLLAQLPNSLLYSLSKKNTQSELWKFGYCIDETGHLSMTFCSCLGQILITRSTRLSLLTLSKAVKMSTTISPLALM